MNQTLMNISVLRLELSKKVMDTDSKFSIRANIKIVEQPAIEDAVEIFMIEYNDG